MKATGSLTSLVNKTFIDWRDTGDSLHKQFKHTITNESINPTIKIDDFKALDYDDTMCTIFHNLYTLPISAKEQLIAANGNTLVTYMFKLISSSKYINKQEQLSNDLADEINKETEYLQKKSCPGVETLGITVYIEESEMKGLFFSVFQYSFILIKSQLEVVPVDVPIELPDVVPEPPKPKRNRHKNRRRNQAAAAIATSLEVPGVPVASDIVEDLHEVDDDPC